MNTLYRGYEDRAERLCCEVDPAFQEFVLNELNVMIMSADINA